MWVLSNGKLHADDTKYDPVNGKFSQGSERAVYDAVLRVKDQASAMLTPEVIIQDYHKEVGLIMAK